MNIAPEGAAFCPGSIRPQCLIHQPGLKLPSWTGGADTDHALRPDFMASHGDQHIPWVFPPGYRCNGQSLGQLHGKVLGAVDRKVYDTFLYGLLKLRYKDTLAPEFL